jgi:hypothetical protein
MRRFHGFDHIDTRVSALALVEPFYDRLMPELGMPRKNHAHVDENGDWHEPDEARPYNAVEYYEPIVSGGVVCFIGFIEDRAMTPTLTRIAFRVSTAEDLPRWHEVLTSIGANKVEWSASAEYPAIFFEDPAGTKLEVVARRPTP